MKSQNCSEALAREATKELCSNFRGIRQRVMCQAWREADKGAPYGEAIRKAWREAVETCRSLGSNPALGPEPQKIKMSYLKDPETGQRVGKIVLTDDREVTLCLAGDCSTTRGGKRIYYLAQHLFDQLGYGIEEAYSNPWVHPSGLVVDLPESQPPRGSGWRYVEFRK